MSDAHIFRLQNQLRSDFQRLKAKLDSNRYEIFRYYCFNHAL